MSLIGKVSSIILLVKSQMSNSFSLFRENAPQEGMNKKNILVSFRSYSDVKMLHGCKSDMVIDQQEWFSHQCIQVACNPLPNLQHYRNFTDNPIHWLS